MIFFLLIWSLNSLGFFALACSMSKHQKQLFQQELNTRTTQLTALVGWCSLVSALLICLSLGTPSNNISYWFGALTMAALTVGLAISYIAPYFWKCIGTLVLVLIISYITLLN
ncbi:DUF3325 domain-containing protein [Acinetobacter bouvetii]|uniref:DUF3325 domain-containing protein n=1 Tax=Acinetobacter bouvetii TaxID=202951 RepID=A0A811GF14_9GAMM|nr:DUF3325 domain-containing protein [Acinetobacter bouvetii]CAB1215476.1 hypothetical protein SFB21_1730 [Acinetobacter bouvetii]